jgi:GH15 family glucan-1,4-alpha-glucosidase
MPATRTELLARSIDVILQGQAPTGAYLAAPTFPTYRYSWFRDGAFIAEAMSRVGRPDSAEAFYGWCDRIMTDRRAKIADLIARGRRDPSSVPAGEHLHTRYTVDGTETGAEWQDFQLDGYGTWLWSLDRHTRRHRRSRLPFRHGVELTVGYLCTFWDSPCFDWWEENGDGRHPSTLAAVRAGLLAAASWPELESGIRDEAEVVAERIARTVAREGVRDGHLTKSFGTDAVDASLIACLTPFELYAPGDRVAIRTLAEVEEQLAPAGVYRFRTDTYYGGGQWILLAALLGWHHARLGNTARAIALLDWIEARADGDLNLPEQVAAPALFPERIDEWVARWGPVACPLLWSHAMYLTLADELGMVTGFGSDRSGPALSGKGT